MATTDRTQQSAGRVLCVGDVHGNIRFLDRAFAVAVDSDAGRIMQVGDFGIWPGSNGARFLAAASSLAVSSGVRLDFVDGNHEDFTFLDHVRATGVPCPDGSFELAPGVFWRPRGSTDVWAGRSVGFLGGAVSVDRHRRRAYESWWPTEVLTDADVDTLTSSVSRSVSGRLEVLFTHDVPAGVPMESWYSWPQDALDDSALVRERISRAVAATRPSLVVHGHWHQRHRTVTQIAGRAVTVVGLSNEDMSALALLDLADLSVW